MERETETWQECMPGQRDAMLHHHRGVLLHLHDCGCMATAAAVNVTTNCRLRHLYVVVTPHGVTLPQMNLSFVALQCVLTNEAELI